MSDHQRRTTHFGYQQVAAEDKADLVRQVFDSVANRYDLMNDLMSLGIHRLWKRRAVELSGVRRAQRVLDLAAGTGDLAARFAGLVGPEGEVVFSDINAAMLEQGRQRMADAGLLGNVHYAQADAQHLPFPDRHFDCISIGFGLRNVTNKQLALEAMFRALKPGGRLLILEFSRPTPKPLRAAYDVYSFRLLPKIGRLVAKDEESYRYLAESIRMHPDQEELKALMKDCGFGHVDVHNLSAGVVALHVGVKC